MMTSSGGSLPTYRVTVKPASGVGRQDLVCRFTCGKADFVINGTVNASWSHGSLVTIALVSPSDMPLQTNIAKPFLVFAYKRKDGWLVLPDTDTLNT